MKCLLYGLLFWENIQKNIERKLHAAVNCIQMYGSDAFIMGISVSFFSNF